MVKNTHEKYFLQVQTRHISLEFKKDTKMKR